MVMTTGQYSKGDKVRVFRVVRNPKNQIHDVIKYDVTSLVGGRSEREVSGYAFPFFKY